MGKRIAITGGIGSGKSSVVKYLATQGFSTFSCDEIYAKVLSEPAYVQEMAKLFPSAVVDGRIDKKILSSIVFNDNVARERLNALAHPIIMQRLFALMNTATSVSFAEVPLLFEGDYDTSFDGIIIVERNDNDRAQAVCKRDGTTIAETERRMKAQEKFFKWKDNQLGKPNVWILQNDKNLETLFDKVDAIVKQIT
ncbi:MAG: dephospho-CoA kinase [Clostridia bacterium]|nr:dephospho-CoA kinase [Clostridia bacterium]